MANHKLLYLILFLIPTIVFGNIAQPGIRNAGGTGTFSLLYTEDSASYKKIQMQKEQVTIQLYNNYAVVKGEYWLYNTTQQAITLKVGYPINTIYKREVSRNRTDIKFDSLYQISVFTDETTQNYNNKELHIQKQLLKSENWYSWNMDIAPKDTALVMVYFIVRTDNTIVSEGYSRDYPNGFMYLLETGAIWKQPILNGKIIIELKDDISIQSIIGVYPDSIFKIDKENKILLYHFCNLYPTDVNNIIVTYKKSKQKFDFGSVIANKEKLFTEIDKLSTQDFTGLHFEQINFKSPFKIPDGMVSNIFFGMLYIIFEFWYVIIIAIVLMILLFRNKKTK